jgi:hypothetical protein
VRHTFFNLRDENFQCVIAGTVGEVRALSPTLSLYVNVYVTSHLSPTKIDPPHFSLHYPLDGQDCVSRYLQSLFWQSGGVSVPPLTFIHGSLQRSGTIGSPRLWHKLDPSMSDASAKLDEVRKLIGLYLPLVPHTARGSHCSCEGEVTAPNPPDSPQCPTFNTYINIYLYTCIHVLFLSS